jgi:exodeoxyribonuclease VII small subunit
MKKDANDILELDYESALKQLEEITARLESEQLPLEEMLAMYTRGQELANRCNQLLDEAEVKVKTLNSGGDGGTEG